MRFFISAALAAAFCCTATAQSIPPKGSDATFDVATWNIEWFGSESNGPDDEAEQLRNVVRVIEESDIDLWAVQEIDDENAFASLLAELGPDYDGYLGRGSTNLMVGFIFKTAVVDPFQVSDAWLSQFEDDFAGRPPLLMQADIVFPDTTVELYLASLHMKCCGDGYDQRSGASTAIYNNLDFHSDWPIILLGDFNDELTGSISGSNPSPYENFLEDSEAYLFASLSLEENDEETWCSNLACSSGSNLDHILITDELFEAYVDGSTDRYDELLDALDSYVFSTSDHLPVFASFSFSTGTAAEESRGSEFGLRAIHPNPVSGTGTLEFSLSAPAWVDIDVYDALGRKAKSVTGSFRTAGMHRAQLSLDELAVGTYFVRLSAGEKTAVQPIVIAR